MLAVLSAGCLRVEQILTLNADGSGTLEMTYGMSEERNNQFREHGDGLTNAPGAAGPLDFSEADVRRDFEAYRDLGVDLVSVDRDVRDGWVYRKLTVRFRDLEGLASTELFSDRRISVGPDEQGRVVFVESADENPGEPAGANGLKEFAGFRMVVRIRTPTPILETTADTHTEKEAVWTFDMDSDSNAISRAQGTDLKVVFSGRGAAIRPWSGGGTRNGNRPAPLAPAE